MVYSQAAQRMAMDSAGNEGSGSRSLKDALRPALVIKHGCLPADGFLDCLTLFVCISSLLNLHQGSLNWLVILESLACRLFPSANAGIEQLSTVP